MALKEYENQIETLKKQIETLKESQEREKRNLKTTAIRHCVGIYKSKVAEVSKLLQDEVVTFFKKFTNIRK